MLEALFSPIFTTSFTGGQYILCAIAALFLGALVAAATALRSQCSRSLVLALTLLPAVVQTVIMLVNGNVGTGVAVAGAFSLVRFRSAPGSAREIASLFICMAVGLACATGYLGLAAVFTALMCAALLLGCRILSKPIGSELELKLTVPESLNYTHAFDDLFEDYTGSCRLVSVKTAAMGSLYKLHYRVRLKNAEREREFLDALRVRNGNLEISLGLAPVESEAL